MMALIRFEGRDLRSYAEPASGSKLRKGAEYFFVEYVDDSGPLLVGDD
jgi:hypothetical protein